MRERKRDRVKERASEQSGGGGMERMRETDKKQKIKLEGGEWRE